jgi:hypothetical protein
LGLGIVAATAALVTGLLGNVLAANISAFFSGTPPKTGKRPVVLWAAFFVSASLSVLAGSFATFAPVAPTPPQPPKIVVTNLRSQMLQSDAKSLFMICRDAVQMANTSDVTTSVVAVGTEINLDGTVLTFDPTANLSLRSNGQVRVAVKIWKTPPAAKSYANIKTIDQFTPISGVLLPLKVEARSTATIYADFALKFTKLMPQSVTVTHILRFPDIADIQTDAMACR